MYQPIRISRIRTSSGNNISCRRKYHDWHSECFLPSFWYTVLRFVGKTLRKFWAYLGAGESIAITMYRNYIDPFSTERQKKTKGISTRRLSKWQTFTKWRINIYFFFDCFIKLLTCIITCNVRIMRYSRSLFLFCHLSWPLCELLKHKNYFLTATFHYLLKDKFNLYMLFRSFCIHHQLCS